MAPADPASARGSKPRLLYVVSEDWYFLSHRLPMARAAQAAGFEVHVATRVVDGAAAIAREGFVVHPIPFVRGRLAPLASLRTILALRRLHRQLSPDLVHRVALQPTVLDGIAAVGYRNTAVNAVTGLGYAFASSSLKARVFRALVSTVLRLLAATGRSVVLVQNPDDAKVLEELGIDTRHIVLVPGSGVDVKTLTPLPEPSGPATIAFAGRLIESKGIRTLVDAHRALRHRPVPVSLLIAGTPDAANPASIKTDEIAAWAQEPGVSWLGHVDAIAEVWARAHIAVQPSHGGEGVPKSSLEAAACGRPLIASDVPGCRDIVIDGVTGLLVPPNDPAALADAIARLAEAPDLRRRMAAAARQLAVERFSAEAVGRATSDLYWALLSTGSGSDGATGGLRSSFAGLVRRGRRRLGTAGD